jgi:hypothetical protein
MLPHEEPFPTGHLGGSCEVHRHARVGVVTQAGYLYAVAYPTPSPRGYADLPYSPRLADYRGADQYACPIGESRSRAPYHPLPHPREEHAPAGHERYERSDAEEPDPPSDRSPDRARTRDPSHRSIPRRPRAIHFAIRARFSSPASTSSPISSRASFATTRMALARTSLTRKGLCLVDGGLVAASALYQVHEP